MIKLPSLNKKGFTLLELVVVFSILAILSTLGVASYVSYSRTQALQQAYQDFLNTVNLARANAASQVKPSQCISSSVLQGYIVDVNLRNDSSNPNSYMLQAKCTNGTFDIWSARKFLPTGVVFNTGTDSPPTTTTSILFSVLTSGVNNAGDVVISYPGFSEIDPKTVTITSVGGIQ